MAILFLLNGMVKVFLSLHDKHSTPLRLRAIMRIKKGAGNMAQDVYNSQYGNVKYMEVVNDIEEEIDMWTAEFMKYFKVHKVDSYKKAIDTIS